LDASSEDILEMYRREQSNMPLMFPFNNLKFTLNKSLLVLISFVTLVMSLDENVAVSVL
jgi:hypothetical protein